MGDSGCGLGVEGREPGPDTQILGLWRFVGSPRVQWTSASTRKAPASTFPGTLGTSSNHPRNSGYTDGGPVAAVTLPPASNTPPRTHTHPWWRRCHTSPPLEMQNKWFSQQFGHLHLSPGHFPLLVDVLCCVVQTTLGNGQTGPILKQAIMIEPVQLSVGDVQMDTVGAMDFNAGCWRHLTGWGWGWV